MSDANYTDDRKEYVQPAIPVGFTTPMVSPGDPQPSRRRICPNSGTVKPR